MRKIATLALIAASTLAVSTPAHAAQIEQADRKVPRVRVVYTEPMPTRGQPARLYFELNNGATYRVRDYQSCRKENRPRLCRRAYYIELSKELWD